MNVRRHQREAMHGESIEGCGLLQQDDETLKVRATPKHRPVIVPALNDVNARPRDEYPSPACHSRRKVEANVDLNSPSNSDASSLM
jgi:hypothetical protein